MTLDDLNNEWINDSDIDPSELGNESLKTPKLHQKWSWYLVEEKKALYALVHQLEQRSIVWEMWLLKTMTESERQDYNNAGYKLPPFSDKRILKPDVEKNLNSIDEISKLKIKIGLQNDKIDYIKSVLGMIGNRSFQIKDAIAWAQYTSGL